MTTKIKTQEVVTVDKKVASLVAGIEKLEIATPKDMESATVLLSNLNKTLDGIVADREKITKPLNESLKEVRSRYKPAETQLNGWINILRGKIGYYQTEQTKIANAEAEAIAARVGEGKGSFKPETAARKIGEIDVPDVKVETAAGSIRFRTDKVLKITDRQKIKEYVVNKNDWSFMAINERKLLEDLKAGKVVDGAEIEEVQTPINSR